MKMIRIDASKGKDGIMDAFANQMNFPDYFGRNWDALEECFDDALTGHDGAVRVHIDATGAKTDDMYVLGSLMAIAAQEHANLSVTFKHGSDPDMQSPAATAS